MVRLGCPRCRRSGQFRLARLAEKFGAKALLANVVAALTSDCNLRNEAGGHPYGNWCPAYLPDLQKPQPPPDERPAGLRVDRAQASTAGSTFDFVVASAMTIRVGHSRTETEDEYSLALETDTSRTRMPSLSSDIAIYWRLAGRRIEAPRCRGLAPHKRRCRELKTRPDIHGSTSVPPAAA